MKILVCAGGTGGGIYPALAAVHELKQLGITRDHILWIGIKGEMEETLIPRAGINLATIDGGAIAGVSRLTQLKNGIKLLRSVWTSRNLIRSFQPDVVFVTGGYMSVPVVAAAQLTGRRSVVYLPDLEPGSAIKLIARLISKVTATFEASAEYFPAGKPFTATGYPIREELRLAAEMSKTEARQQFNLGGDKPTLFVTGGSRGAWSINQAMINLLPELLKTTQVIHASGTLTWDQVEAFAADLPAELRQNYRPYPYLHEEMGAAYRAADLVVARAGASVMGECPLFGVPAVLVPYPHAWRYQKVNADFLVKQGAAIRLDDHLLESSLLPTLQELLQNTVKLQEMATASSSLKTTNAARNLAQAIISVGKGNL